jgi:hypothetical protein
VGVGVGVGVMGRDTCDGRYHSFARGRAAARDITVQGPIRLPAYSATTSRHFNSLCVWAFANTFSELAREKAWSRINLVPAILAEQDRDHFRRSQAALAREKEIMKDVPNWEVSAAAYRAWSHWSRV